MDSLASETKEEDDLNGFTTGVIVRVSLDTRSLQSKVGLQTDAQIGTSLLLWRIPVKGLFFRFLDSLLICEVGLDESLNSVPCKPLFRKQCQLLQLPQSIAAVEDTEVVFAHFLEKRVVDAVHHPGRKKRLVIFGGEKVGGFLIELFTTIRLVGHEGDEAVIVNSVNEVLLGVLKATEVVERDIDAGSV